MMSASSELKSSKTLRVLVYGAGAIGTFIGGSLALNGNQVVFIERPDIAVMVKTKGLHLRMEEREYTLSDPIVAGSLEQALTEGPFDISIFALKSNDTQPALKALAPYHAQLPPFLCLQNGVENEPALAAFLGAENVIAGTVTSSVARRAAGDIILEKRRGIGIARSNPLSTRLVEVFNRAGLDAHLYDRHLDMKWSKMLTNLLGNASSAILGMPPGEVFAHPGLFRIEIEQLRETLRVMSALGIRAMNIPHVPVYALGIAARYFPLALARPMMIQAVGNGRGGKMPSFYIDLHSGRGTSEVDYLNGAVVRHGQRLGIQTPVNRWLNETLLALTNGNLAIDTYAQQPDKFIEQVWKFTDNRKLAISNQEEIR